MTDRQDDFSPLQGMENAKWRTDELIPKSFTLLEVEDDRSRITPCHVEPGYLLAFPAFGSSFSTPVHAVDGDWIYVPRQLRYVQTTEEWYVPYNPVGDEDVHMMSQPYEYMTPGEYGEWRGRALRFPITRVRNLAVGQEGVICGPMYAENGSLKGATRA